MTSDTLAIGLVLGSTREGRQGERVARWVEREAARDGRLKVTFIDLAQWMLPYYRHPTPMRVAERSLSDERDRGWVDLVGSQDGFVFVTPEYNHGYPAVLKNALDSAATGWVRKAVAFVSYGGSSGGVRAVEQLRLVAVELQLAPIRDEVNIPFIGRALDERGEPKDDFHRKRLEAMIAELAWWTAALKAARGPR